MVMFLRVNLMCVCTGTFASAVGYYGKFLRGSKVGSLGAVSTYVEYNPKSTISQHNYSIKHDQACVFCLFQTYSLVP